MSSDRRRVELAPRLSARPSPTRVVVADGAMGTMLQAQDPTLDDFEGHEGCNEILNVTRPDIVRVVHEAYFDAGVDAVETNTFGANLANLAEYGIEDRIEELAEAGARIAREVADDRSTDGPAALGDRLGRPGHQAADAGPRAVRHAARRLRDAGRAACSPAACTRVLVETAQDLLQAKAAVIGARRALTAAGLGRCRCSCQVTVETTGTMLLGSEIGAALTALEPLGIDVIGLNCATGPAEMSEHLRHLSRHARIGLSLHAQRRAADAGQGRRVLPAHARAARRRARPLHQGLRPRPGRRLLRHDARAPAPGRRAGAAAAASRPARPRPEAGRRVALPARAVPPGHVVPLDRRAHQRQRLARRSARRCSRSAGTTASRSPATRPATARTCSTSASTTSAATASRDMKAVASRFATASTLPIVLDSTEPAVIEAGLELLGGRSVVNSVNYEDGDGPGSRFARVMPIVQEHGAAVVALCIDEEGQARTAEWKVRVATRLIEDLTGQLGDARRGHRRRLPDVPDRAPARRRPAATALETIEAIRQLKAAYPTVQTTLGVSNVSFGLNPAARIVLNSVFLHECVKAGLDSAIVHAAKILPMSEDPRGAARGRARPGLRPPPRGLRPAAALPRPVRGRRHRQRAREPRRGARRAAAGRAAGPPDHRRRAQRPRGRPAGGARPRQAGARHRQRPPARGHEGRRRAVRQGRDAAAVRAAVGRGDEDRRRLARAAHGEDRRGRQGHHRARHRQGRRPRHRQEPRRHHPVQQRLHRRQHRHQAAGLRDPRRRRRAPGRRHRHVRPAREVDGHHEGEPRGDELPGRLREVPGASSAAPRSPGRTSSRTSPRSTRARCATPATPSRVCG